MGLLLPGPWSRGRMRELRRRAVKSNRKSAMKWLAEQDGPLRTILGELVLIGCILEKPAPKNGAEIKLRGPGTYTVATLRKRTRYKGETKHVPYYEVVRPETGWTSGLHKDPVKAVEKYIDKWWRDEDQPKGVG